MTRRGTRIGRADQADAVIHMDITTLNSISGGTQVISTGLATVEAFTGTVMLTRGATPAFVFVQGFGTNGGVTCGFRWNTVTAGGGTSIPNETSGVSLCWTASGQT